MKFQKGKILFVTAADTEILGLSAARDRLPEDFPPVRAIHIRDLADAEDLEEYANNVVPGAKVIVARILGGRAYFQKGFDLLSWASRESGVSLIALPGSRELDPELSAISTIPLSTLTMALEYLVHGGVENYEHFLRFLSDRFLLTGYGCNPPAPTPERGVYETPGLSPLPNDAPLAGILFYRAHWLSGN
ncbi:MAG: cobaltochelatase subunit CobN, partial [bacterium]